MDGTGIVGGSSQQGLVDETAAMPAVGFGQGNSPAYEAAQGTGLRKRLTVELVNPCLWTVGTDNDERLVLVPGFGNGRSQVEQGRPAGDADGDRLVEGLHHAECVEARRPLVGDGVALYVGTLAEIMHDGRVATARADDGVTDTMSHEQSRQQVYVLFVRVHFPRYFVMTLSDGAWFQV